MITRRRFTAGLAAAPAILSRAARSAPVRTIRLGFQKGEPILLSAKQNRSLEARLAPLGLEVQWIEFQFGPPMLEAMRVGSIDIGAVGDTPPVFAQAAHGDLLYLAAQRAGGSAILLPAGSDIRTLEQLKGRKVAFGRGSSAHSLTLAALEKAGLAYGDIQPILLGPADAGAAFERGAIDAWTIWDPYYALFENRPGVRTLVKWTEIAVQNSFVMGSRPFVDANQEATKAVIAGIGAAAAWARANRPAVAHLLSEATGLPLAVEQAAVDRAPFEVLAIDDAIVASQQDVADRFRRLGVLPVDIRVRDQVWRPSA